MIVISGASNNHYKSLINFIKSFVQYNDVHQLIVYNLGIDEDKWAHIQSTYPHFYYRVFEYSKYPAWFNIEVEAGQYAWKPAILYNTYLEHPGKVIVWMDSGNLILDNLRELETIIYRAGVYSSISSGNILRWTHPKTIEYLQCTNVQEQNRNGACIGFNTRVDFARRLLTEFYECCLIKECIAPDGSSRANHRQDQAVFTILFYKYLYDIPALYNHLRWIPYIGYSIHNDAD